MLDPTRPLCASVTGRSKAPVDPKLQQTGHRAAAAKAIASAPKQLDTLQTATRAMQGSVSQGDTADTPKATHVERLAGKLGKPIGALGLVAGGAQGIEGVQELAHGDRRHGLVDAASGGTTLAAGAATLAKSRMAGPLAGVAAMISGVSQLSEAKNREDRTLGAIKVAGGGTLVAAGALEAAGAAADATILGAPVGLALNAAGAIMLGGSALFQYRHTLRRAAEKAGRWLGL